MPEDSKSHKYFDAKKLSKWLNFLVDNIYLLGAKDVVLRQRIGIPMGTNCAVFLANLFCFTYEYEFLVQLVANRKRTLIQKFMYTSRYIDDLLSLYNELFESYKSNEYVDEDGIHGIYPKCLILLKEQEATSGVSFLDTQLCQQDGVWYSKIYDKREHRPLNRISQEKYPHATTFLSSRSKFGVITSQFYRFARICTKKVDFVKRAQSFLRDFRAQEHSPQTMRGFVTRFITKGQLNFHVESVPRFVNKLMEGCK
jgi:hypothetical protein